MKTKTQVQQNQPQNSLEFKGNDCYLNGVYRGSLAFKKAKSVILFLPKGGMQEIQVKNPGAIKTINL